MKRFLACSIGVWSLAGFPLRAAGDYYAGGIAAIATLSSDGQSVVSSTASQVSLYKTENGPAVNVFFGRYLGNYISLQEIVSGAPMLTPRDFAKSIAALRVAVGVDVKLRRGFSLRYSFSETISSNPISEQLSPPGQRPLKNFQNLWGFVKSF